MSARVEEVQKALPNQTALVEFLRYNDLKDNEHEKASYGALIISDQGEPKWVPLGAVGPIEKNLKWPR